MNITIDSYELNNLLKNLSDKEDEWREKLIRAKDSSERLRQDLSKSIEEKEKFEVMASTLQGRVDALTAKLKRYEPALTKKEMEEDDTY